MRLDRRHDRRPPVVRHAEHADAAVVVADVLDQPVDGVVGVGAFIDRLRVAGLAGGTLHHEVALGPELPANVLVNEDVALVRERLVVGVEVAGSALNSVGRAFEDNRQRPGLAARREDLGMQALAVAHGDHHVAHFEAISGVRLLVHFDGSGRNYEEADDGGQEGQRGSALHGGTITPSSPARRR